MTDIDPTLIEEPCCHVCGTPLADDEELDLETGLCQSCAGLADAGISDDDSLPF